MVLKNGRGSPPIIESADRRSRVINQFLSIDKGICPGWLIVESPEPTAGLFEGASCEPRPCCRAVQQVRDRRALDPFRYKKAPIQEKRKSRGNSQSRIADEALARFDKRFMLYQCRV